MTNLKITIYVVFIIFSIGALSSCVRDTSTATNSNTVVDEKESNKKVMMRLSLTTTREKCLACGCKVSFFNCQCPTKKRYACLTKDTQKFLIYEPSELFK